MAKNGDKAGKLSSLELSGESRRPRHRLRRALALFRPITVAWIINVLCAMAILFIISHPREKIDRAVYSNSDPPIALRDFKIPRDQEVIDEEGTEKNRAEAEARTLSVYDWDPAVSDAIKSSVSQFYNGFRELYPPEPEIPEILEGDTVLEPETPIAVPPAFRPEKEQELLKSLGLALSTDDLEALKKYHFSPDLEKATLKLIDVVYAGEPGSKRYVVPNRELLLKDREKGILARTINAPADKPSVKIANLEQVIDLGIGQEMVEKSVTKDIEKLSAEEKDLVARMAKGLLDPNLTFNKDKTEEAKAEARESVKPIYYKFTKGEVIARSGDRITEEKKKKIDIILAARTSPTTRGFEEFGLVSLIILFNASLVSFSRKNIRKFFLEPKDFIFLGLTMVLALGALKLTELFGGPAIKELYDLGEGVNFFYLVPLAAAAMLVRMVLNSEVSLIFAVILSALGGMVADNSVTFALYTMIGATVAAGEVRQCRQRSAIITAGVKLGLVNFLLILVISMINVKLLNLDGALINVIILNGVFGLAGGVFTAIIVTGLVPVAESLFGYATDIKLLELLNQDHPLLKDLSLRAPGTHQHSLMVANLAEAAAKSIGANPLLARVCAMYHDIGKMNKPLYFAENQWDGSNAHDRLSPSMSTLIIHSHVKDGVEMGENHNLPEMVISAIREHHGTGLLNFFYEKAKELNETGVPVEETDFRYPGPKPQTRETAILMLADVVESAARTLRNPNAAQLQGLVQKQINRFFIDGQLDECDLSLKNLHEIARSFNTTLGAIYHQRPDYPQPAAKVAQEKKKKAEQDGAGNKERGKAEGKDERKKDSEEPEDHIKRLGM